MARTRGITVRTLDMSDAAERPVYGYALGRGNDGKTYVICTEGVGWEVTPDRPLFVDTWSGGYDMPLSEVVDRAAHGEDVDLADHVRTFGSRLESNFHMWSRRIG